MNENDVQKKRKKPPDQFGALALWLMVLMVSYVEKDAVH